MMKPKRLYKHNPKDKIQWVDNPDKIGLFEFTFDKGKTIFNVYLDYPHNLTPEQKAIFDKENPEWAQLL